MPAVITHHIFGEDIAGELGAGMLSGEEELLAFLLANQGPDPLFARFSTTPARVRVTRALGAQIQGGRVTRALMALRDGVSRLPAADAGVGRAFALGALGHYALDRVVHPFVIAQQIALGEADADLARASHEVHALIESDLDGWTLWEKRHATVEERPAAGNLMRTERIERVGGALLSQVALSVFGVTVGAGEYARCVRDYELVLRVVNPAGTRRARVLGTIERAVRGRSMIEAAGHYVRRGDECAAANLERRAWKNPFTGEVRHDSFADLFDGARRLYPRLADAFVHGDQGELRALVGGLDYEGRPGTDD